MLRYALLFDLGVKTPIFMIPFLLVVSLVKLAGRRELGESGSPCCALPV